MLVAARSDQFADAQTIDVQIMDRQGADRGTPDHEAANGKSAERERAQRRSTQRGCGDRSDRSRRSTTATHRPPGIASPWKYPGCVAATTPVAAARTTVYRETSPTTMRFAGEISSTLSCSLTNL